MTIDILHQVPTGNGTTEIAMMNAVIAMNVVVEVGTIGKKEATGKKREDTTTAGRCSSLHKHHSNFKQRPQLQQQQQTAASTVNDLWDSAT